MNKFPFYKQHDRKDCGPTCLRMIAKHYGKSYSLQYIREKSSITREGVSLLGISYAAEKLGFRTVGAKLNFDQLEEIILPCIVHWQFKHFVVVYKIKKNTVYVADPSFGLLTHSVDDFINFWTGNNSKDAFGRALLLEPMPRFYQLEEDTPKIGLSFFGGYFTPYRRYYFQLFLGLLTGMIFSLIFPFLTQAVVDVGINTQNINFVNVILLAQATLALSSTILSFVRSWIFLHISTRINVSIISDYLTKLMSLPISFFETKMIGDIIQRIGDNSTIYSFISGTTLNTVFSFLNLIVFSLIMAYYSMKILIIFFIFSILYGGWVILFMKKRKEFNFKMFEKNSQRQTSIIQMINGIRDIKLFNFETQKRWEWESIQAQSFAINIKQMKLNQIQQVGGFFLDQTKNIFISYLAAKSVISGEMTLGMMLSMQYILGQLNAPISQFIGLINSYQDARISLERLEDVYLRKDEQETSNNNTTELLSKNESIALENLSFGYENIASRYVIKDLSLIIPEGKITAIVGYSGSGKTTILKLLLRFYEPSEGKIKVGDFDMKSVDVKAWRDKCGVVLQDGYLFADTIASNIAMGDDDITLEKLEYAAKIANIDEYINSLALGYNTILGTEGTGISQGQRQRILIARAIYKDPKYIFFDEATNSLDTNNEKKIVENLDSFFKGRTVVVIAHRLSTVKNADQIVVLDKGGIIEKGSHTELIRNKGSYYELVKNQLDLDA
jgi:ATP-binding cassette, subfamily B, bacterial